MAEAAPAEPAVAESSPTVADSAEDDKQPFSDYYTQNLLPDDGSKIFSDIHVNFLGPDRVVREEWKKAEALGKPCLDNERPDWQLRADPARESLRESDAAELQEALEKAILNKGVGEVERVIKSGAPLTARFLLEDGGLDPAAGTCLDLAILKCRPGVALRLLQLGDEEGQELAKHSIRALAWAARDGNDEIVNNLLRFGAEVCQYNEKGQSALLLAAMRGKASCVRTLLAAGALEFEDEDSAEEVLQWIRHWKMKTVDDTEPLLGPCSEKAANTKATEAEPGAPEDPQASPEIAKVRELQRLLAYALKYKGVKEVKQLVEAGAPLDADYFLDVDLKITGTALDLAVAARRFRLASELLHASASTTAEELVAASRHALAIAAGDNQIGLLKELLQLGADSCQCDVKGESALLKATKRGNLQCVATLLEAGAWEREAAREDVKEWAQRWKMNVTQLFC